MHKKVVLLLTQSQFWLIILYSICEAAEVLHTGQMGCRRRRSALDAVGCLVQGVHNAWAQRQLAGALFMDVKGAFDHVAAARLIEWMMELGVDQDLIQ